MDKIILKKTADGSHTLYIPSLNESYHSTNGAIQESKHIFIQAGLNYLKKKKINVLEVGFGTGLNTYLTLLEVYKKDIVIAYDTLEAFPLPKILINQLNYTSLLNVNTQQRELFKLIHQAKWGCNQLVINNFSLKKNKVKLGDYVIRRDFDIIYFDAFSPEVQPNMWTKSVFEKMYKGLKTNGILITYCAKGSIKRILKEVGFRVEGLPGPPGKREITRAIKD